MNTLGSLPEHDSTAGIATRLPLGSEHAQLQQVLSDPRVLALVRGIADLPTSPKTYHDLTRAIQRGASMPDIAAIVESDVGMSVKVLQFVNSAFFGLARRTTSIAQAVSMLGVQTLKGLVVATYMTSAAQNGLPKMFSLQTFQARSLKLGQLARRMIVSRDLADDAFTAGIVCHIGKIVIALKEPTVFSQVLERAAKAGEPDYAIERELLGVSHAEAGAMLLSLWQFPPAIIEVAAFHDRPQGLDPTDREILATVYAADTLMNIIGCNDPESTLDLEYLRQAGLVQELPHWRELAERSVAELMK